MKIYFIPSNYHGGIGRDYSAFQNSFREILQNNKQPKSKDVEFTLIPKIPFFKIGSVYFYFNKKNQYVLNAQFDSRIIIIGKGTIIQRLHDIFPITNPNWFTCKARISFQLAFIYLKNKKVIYVANSKFTRDETSKYINQEILLHYCKDILKPISACGECQGCRLSLESPYYLFVGTVEPRKNYRILPVIATALADFEFVVVGKNGWKCNEIIQNFQETLNVKYIEECCDYALDGLYRNCKAFISTSLEEGFNIPALEAHNRGAKLILSDIPVHREIYGHIAKFCTTTYEFVEEIKNIENFKPTQLNGLNYVTTLDKIIGSLK
jgi:glycosyltransferase involved in cell wall biosynthesis